MRVVPREHQLLTGAPGMADETPGESRDVLAVKTFSRAADLSHRGRFIRRLTQTGAAFIVAGEHGWATVGFRYDPKLQVLLVWSNRNEAERWADVIAVAPKVCEVGLPQLMTDILPVLEDRRCLVGHDWCSDPADPVIMPGELIERIWRERTDQFITAIASAGAVWVLESASGPALWPSGRFVGKYMLPLWASREAAAANCAGTWSSKRPLGIDLVNFRERYLPYVTGNEMTVAPAPLAGAGARELTGSEFLNLAYPGVARSQLRAVG